jgi:hypothetical protein
MYISYQIWALINTDRYNWNIVESGVKHHQTNKQTTVLTVWYFFSFYYFLYLIVFHGIGELLFIFSFYLNYCLFSCYFLYLIVFHGVGVLVLFFIFDCFSWRWCISVIFFRFNYFSFFVGGLLFYILNQLCNVLISLWVQKLKTIW